MNAGICFGAWIVLSIPFSLLIARWMKVSSR